jgi:hypothetical protein
MIRSCPRMSHVFTGSVGRVYKLDVDNTQPNTGRFLDVAGWKRLWTRI